MSDFGVVPENILRGSEKEKKSVLGLEGQSDQGIGRAILNYIRTNKTKTGLKVNAGLVKKNYAKGIKITDAAMTGLNIKQPNLLPKWNYALRPSKNGQ